VGAVGGEAGACAGPTVREIETLYVLQSVRTALSPSPSPSLFHCLTVN
jgi:hypothetical protein